MISVLYHVIVAVLLFTTSAHPLSYKNPDCIIDDIDGILESSLPYPLEEDSPVFTKKQWESFRELGSKLEGGKLKENFYRAMRMITHSLQEYSKKNSNGLNSEEKSVDIGSEKAESNEQDNDLMGDMTVSQFNFMKKEDSSKYRKNNHMLLHAQRFNASHEAKNKYERTSKNSLQAEVEGHRTHIEQVKEEDVLKNKSVPNSFKIEKEDNIDLPGPAGQMSDIETQKKLSNEQEHDLIGDMTERQSKFMKKEDLSKNITNDYMVLYPQHFNTSEEEKNKLETTPVNSFLVEHKGHIKNSEHVGEEDALKTKSTATNSLKSKKKDDINLPGHQRSAERMSEKLEDTLLDTSSNFDSYINKTLEKSSVNIQEDLSEIVSDYSTTEGQSELTPTLISEDQIKNLSNETSSDEYEAEEGDLIPETSEKKEMKIRENEIKNGSVNSSDLFEHKANSVSPDNITLGKQNTLDIINVTHKPVVTAVMQEAEDVSSTHGSTSLYKSISEEKDKTENYENRPLSEFRNENSTEPEGNLLKKSSIDSKPSNINDYLPDYESNRSTEEETQSSAALNELNESNTYTTNKNSDINVERRKSVENYEEEELDEDLSNNNSQQDNFGNNLSSNKNSAEYEDYDLSTIRRRNATHFYSDKEALGMAEDLVKESSKEQIKYKSSKDTRNITKSNEEANFTAIAENNLTKHFDSPLTSGSLEMEDISATSPTNYSNAATRSSNSEDHSFAEEMESTESVEESITDNTDKTNKSSVLSDIDNNNISTSAKEVINETQTNFDQKNVNISDNANSIKPENETVPLEDSENSLPNSNIDEVEESDNPIKTTDLNMTGSMNDTARMRGAINKPLTQTEIDDLEFIKNISAATSSIHGHLTFENSLKEQAPNSTEEEGVDIPELNSEENSNNSSKHQLGDNNNTKISLTELETFPTNRETNSAENKTSYYKSSEAYSNQSNYDSALLKNPLQNDSNIRSDIDSSQSFEDDKKENAEKMKDMNTINKADIVTNTEFNSGEKKHDISDVMHDINNPDNKTSVYQPVGFTVLHPKPRQTIPKGTLVDSSTDLSARNADETSVNSYNETDTSIASELTSRSFQKINETLEEYATQNNTENDSANNLSGDSGMSDSGTDRQTETLEKSENYESNEDVILTKQNVYDDAKPQTNYQLRSSPEPIAISETANAMNESNNNNFTREVNSMDTSTDNIEFHATKTKPDQDNLLSKEMTARISDDFSDGELDENDELVELLPEKTSFKSSKDVLKYNVSTIDDYVDADNDTTSTSLIDSDVYSKVTYDHGDIYANRTNNLLDIKLENFTTHNDTINSNISQPTVSTMQDVLNSTEFRMSTGSDNKHNFSEKENALSTETTSLSTFNETYAITHEENNAADSENSNEEQPLNVSTFAAEPFQSTDETELRQLDFNGSNELIDRSEELTESTTHFDSSSIINLTTSSDDYSITNVTEGSTTNTEDQSENRQNTITYEHRSLEDTSKAISGGNEIELTQPNLVQSPDSQHYETSTVDITNIIPSTNAIAHYSAKKDPEVSLIHAKTSENQDLEATYQTTTKTSNFDEMRFIESDSYEGFVPYLSPVSRHHSQNLPLPSPVPKDLKRSNCVEVAEYVYNSPGR